MSKLYICGPISGLPDRNRPAFTTAAIELVQAGYEPVNPQDLQDNPQTWEQALRIDLRAMLECDGIATLPGSGFSRGCQLELEVARRLKIPAQPVRWWVEYAASAGVASAPVFA